MCCKRWLVVFGAYVVFVGLYVTKFGVRRNSREGSLCAWNLLIILHSLNIWKEVCTLDWLIGWAIFSCFDWLVGCWLFVVRLCLRTCAGKIPIWDGVAMTEDGVEMPLNGDVTTVELARLLQPFKIIFACNDGGILDKVPQTKTSSTPQRLRLQQLQLHNKTTTTQ